VRASALLVAPSRAVWLGRHSREVAPQDGGVEGSLHAERPREGPTPYGKVEALQVGVQVRSPARKPPCEVWGDTPVDHHEAE